MSLPRQARSFALALVDDPPGDGELHPKVMAEVREMVVANGADEEEAAVLLLVLERLRRIQAADGVSAALAAARAVKAIWLEEQLD
jgi:hypothetical protein